jgi:uncharacterized membrane protein YphA (DoxX/SURF4 family)
VLLIGRILLGWIFVRSGYGKLFNVEAVANLFPQRSRRFGRSWRAKHLIRRFGAFLLAEGPAALGDRMMV